MPVSSLTLSRESEGFLKIHRHSEGLKDTVQTSNTKPWISVKGKVNKGLRNEMQVCNMSEQNQKKKKSASKVLGSCAWQQTGTMGADEGYTPLYICHTVYIYIHHAYPCNPTWGYLSDKSVIAKTQTSTDDNLYQCFRYGCTLFLISHINLIK